MKKAIWITSVLIVTIIVLVLTLLYVKSTPRVVKILNKDGPLTEDESRFLAEDYITHSPTYSFDGHNLTFMESKPLGCEACWTHTFYFYSDYLGYGNPRTDLYAHKTTNVVSITFKNKDVYSATINRVWDEMNQNFI